VPFLWKKFSTRLRPRFCTKLAVRVVAILSAEFCTSSRRFSWEGGAIDDGSNERLVQGQKSFSVAALGWMSQNLE